MSKQMLKLLWSGCSLTKHLQHTKEVINVALCLICTTCTLDICVPAAAVWQLRSGCHFLQQYTSVANVFLMSTLWWHCLAHCTGTLWTLHKCCHAGHTLPPCAAAISHYRVVQVLSCLSDVQLGSTP